MKKITEEFNFKYQKQTKDYEAFTDKNLLEELRYKIIDNLIKEHKPVKDINLQIKEQIKAVTKDRNLKNIEIDYLHDLINNEIHGYGPLTDLLKDPAITEIMVNGKDEIYIEIDGKIIRDDSISFINDNHIIRTIQRIIQPVGRSIDISHPMVDARLPDGSRLNAIIPPLAVNGPILTIRKFKTEIFNIEELLRNGTVTPYMARFLNAAIRAKANVIICGGTGGGKTTLLNVLSGLIANHERIITIEEAVELKLKQDHVIALETRTKNYEGQGEVTIKDLVINALHMRPDRIIVGEVRGGEAFDMLQAMNTGHEGSLTTLHANSSRDALNRLEAMVLMSGMEVPVVAVREYINNAIDLVVHIERLSDGRRKVVDISEVTGIEDDQIKLQSIFAFNQTGVTENNEVLGEFVLYDYQPKIYEKIKQRGCDDIADIFGDKNE